MVARLLRLWRGFTNPFQRPSPRIIPSGTSKRVRRAFLAAPIALILISNCHAQVASLNPNNSQLQSARLAYFDAVRGDSSQLQLARRLFAALDHTHPHKPLIHAYQGSLDLLQAARTWQLWNQHELAQQGLSELDQAVKDDPEDLEVRFIRAATTWHLPFFFHRKQQSEEDFLLIAPKVEAASREGQLPAPIAAAALNYKGLILAEHKNVSGAQQAFRSAFRVAPNSPAGEDAASRIH
jgi:hypothetical protein